MIRPGSMVQVVFKEPIQEYTNLSGRLMSETENGVTIRSAGRSTFILWKHVGFVQALAVDEE